MRRLRCTMILLLFISLSLSAGHLGLSIGTFGNGSSGLFGTGTQVQGGLVFGFAPRWETELFVITAATADPFSRTIGGVGISYAVVSPVYTQKEVPSYGNTSVGFGLMGDISDLSSYGPFLRVTPVAVGGPQFKLRERAVTFGTYYDVPNKSFTLFWNVFMLDFFISRSS